MPLYDYRCDKGHRYEAQEPFGSPPTQPCRRCGSPAKRLLTVPAIAFKGSGWYKTDSRGTGANGARKGDSKDKKKGNSEGDGKASSRSSAGGERKSKARSDSSADTSSGGASGSGGSGDGD
jgi:putative FmdB family regulatory protein